MRRATWTQRLGSSFAIAMIVGLLVQASVLVASAGNTNLLPRPFVPLQGYGGTTAEPTAFPTQVGQMSQQVIVQIQPGTFLTAGSFTAFVGGIPCGTVTVSPTGTATLNLAQNCAVQGRTIEFRETATSPIVATATLPATAPTGATIITVQATRFTAAQTGPAQTGQAAPRPPRTGSAGLADDNQGLQILMGLGMLTAALAGGAAVRRAARVKQPRAQ